MAFPLLRGELRMRTLGQLEGQILALFASLRSGILLLCLGLAIGSADHARYPVVAELLLLLLAVQSGLTFRYAYRQWKRTGERALDGRVALVETVAGVVALTVLAILSPRSTLTSPSFWAAPYTVVSALVVAASTTFRAALVEVSVLTAGYVLAISPNFVALRSGGDVGAAASALDNALSYPAFACVVALVVLLFRTIALEAEEIGNLVRQYPAERARLDVATRAYRIGHDIPKALLRQVARQDLHPERLAELAAQARADLLRSLTGDPRRSVPLAQELQAVTAYFQAGMVLHTAIDLPTTPAGAPALVLTEAVREALNNATYHRFGYPARVEARLIPPAIVITIWNGGPGSLPARLMAAWALKENAIHRVEVVGGAYDVASDPDDDCGGTTVRLTWPASTS
jgi:hypothetical protein